MEPEFHHHPLTSVWKWITFTCDLCGKTDKGMPYLCNPCGFWIHGRCSLFPRKVKVVHHKHLLHLIHSSLEFHQSDSRFCQICVQEVDTCYGLYYCSRCDFVAHLNCAMENKENINLQEFKDEDEVSELDESVDSTYKVKKYNMREGGIQIAAEIKHFSHEHDLMVTEQLLKNQKCDGCVRAIVPPFYSCVKCSFFLHESCANLPKKKQHPLHQHPLSLLPMKPSKDFRCYACHRKCNGFTYSCETCRFRLDVQCSMISEILTHPGHDHTLILSGVESSQNCSCCDSRTYPIFRCTTCAFALDFRCATLPHSIRYKQHEHPFALSYRAEDNSSEYYCDICEEKRDSKYWFYCSEDCSYLAHPKCIIGKYPNYKFGGTYTFDCHSHPLTFIEETKDRPRCNKCNDTCEKECLDPFEKLECEAFDIFVNEALCVGKVPRQLIVELYRLKQEPQQSIDDFFFHTCNICGSEFHYMNQHGLCLQCPIFCEYRDQLKKFSSLPSIEKVFKERVQEDSRPFY
ncbi:hypothetical protein CMV_004052 [Castanea mollissima]|uniref:DC1 domain-containing protein n=1 Tax=Castanea mollissima TaxID=60419 RepID=A0A8J4RFU8_9ROSI|nr:hypothetical protein CMV_004052 [Castanea mollissima]